MGNLSRDLLMSLPDPAPSWRWRVFMPAIATASYSSSTGIVVQAANVPFQSMPPEERYGGGTYVKFPGFHNIGDCSITLYENYKYDVTKYLQAWSTLVIDPETGIYGMPVDYRKTITAELYDTLSDTSPQLQIQLQFAWPTQPQDFDLSYTESSARTVQANFSVSRFKIT